MRHLLTRHHKYSALLHRITVADMSKQGFVLLQRTFESCCGRMKLNESKMLQSQFLSSSSVSKEVFGKMTIQQVDVGFSPQVKVKEGFEVIIRFMSGTNQETLVIFGNYI